MREALRNQWQVKLAAGVFLLFFAWWVSIQVFTESNDTLQHQIFAATYGIMALIGGVWGLLISRKWGGYKSLIGKSLMFFSLGLLAQEFGQLVYSFYIYFLKVEIPYPSIGDIGYFGSVVLYCLAGIYLARAAGVSLRLRSLTHVIPAIAITFGILALGFYLFLQDYVVNWSSPIKVLLDFGYPIGEAIYISIAIGTYILSKGVLGGIMKSKILFIIFALCVQFVADYTFLYQASRETWYAGGLNDYIYLFAYFLMTVALLEFGQIFNKLKNGG